MTSVFTYTSFYEVQQDLSLYIAIQNNKTLTLDLFQQLAINRWGWIISQWSKYKPIFQSFVNGSEYYVNSFSQMENDVTTVLIGGTSNVLDDSNKFHLYSPFLSLITIAEMKLNKSEQNLVNQQIQQVNLFTISRFRAMLTYIKTQGALMAMQIGLADSTSAAIRGLTLVQKQRQPSYDDYTIMGNLIEMERFIEGIIFGLKQNNLKPPNLLAAANSNIDSSSPVTINNNYLSSISVIFNGSLQTMALKYLGSVDRWYELVTINNLKPPFIDDIGTKVFLLASGSGNAIYISDSIKESVLVGSKIAVGSYRYRESVRIVEKVVDNKDGTLTIFLSGANNLSTLTLNDKAYARVYLPNTTSTGSFILIPQSVALVGGNVPTPENDVLKQLDRTLLAFGVDIQRSEITNDILIDPTGNFAMAYGVPNIRQAVLTVIRTEQGELAYWENFGLPQEIGSIYFGQLSEAQILSDVISGAVSQDPRFGNVLVTNLQTAGNSVTLSLNCYLEGTSTVIPLSFIG